MIQIGESTSRHVFVSPVLIPSSTNHWVDHLHPTRYLSHLPPRIFYCLPLRENNNAVKFIVSLKQNNGGAHHKSYLALKRVWRIWSWNGVKISSSQKKRNMWHFLFIFLIAGLRSMSDKSQSISKAEDKIFLVDVETILGRLLFASMKLLSWNKVLEIKRIAGTFESEY